MVDGWSHCGGSLFLMLTYFLWIADYFKRSEFSSLIIIII